MFKGTLWDCLTFSKTCKRFMTFPGLQLCQCLLKNSMTNLTENLTEKGYDLTESYGDAKSEDDIDECITDIDCQD